MIIIIVSLLKYTPLYAPVVINHGKLGPCPRPWRGEERTTGPPLYADFGLGAKDYERGIGRGRGYMERGPDSV